MNLTKITIAPVNVDEMVQFYDAVFDTQLKPFEAMGTTLYNGRLAGIPLLFCPNEILGIKAEKNRQQLSFSTNDFDGVVQKALANGGAMLGEVQEGPQGKACGITDPDGNSIELIENS